MDVLHPITVAANTPRPQRQRSKAIWLSIIVPTYNGARFLRAALDSVASQVDDGVEVIAVDDGSTDSTPAILRSYAKRLPLCIVSREHRGNWVANANYGLSIAKGEYISLLHQDDLWAPQRLAILKGMTSQYPAAPMTLHPSWFIDVQGRKVGGWRPPFPTVSQELSGAMVFERLLVQNFICVAAPLFRAETVAKLGGLDETLWYVADWDLWLKIASTGSIVYHPRPLVAFRVHSESQTWARAGQVLELRRQYNVVLGRHLVPWEARPPTNPVVARVARYSVEVNLALAARAHRKPVDVFRLFGAFIALGPMGWTRYLRDSRIGERVFSRWRAGLISRGKGYHDARDKA
ncbi:MAG: glycosyltransferase [Pirellulales bacterium]